MEDEEGHAVWKPATKSDKGEEMYSTICFFGGTERRVKERRIEGVFFQRLAAFGGDCTRNMAHVLLG